MMNFSKRLFYKNSSFNEKYQLITIVYGGYMNHLCRRKYFKAVNGRIHAVQIFCLIYWIMRVY